MARVPSDLTPMNDTCEKTIDAHDSGTFRNFTPIDNTCEKTIDAYDSTIYIYTYTCIHVRTQ